MLREQLPPALMNKPKRVPTPEPKTEATSNEEPEAKGPSANKSRTNPKEGGTEK